MLLTCNSCVKLCQNHKHFESLIRIKPPTKWIIKKKKKQHKIYEMKTNRRNDDADCDDYDVDEKT